MDTLTLANRTIVNLLALILGAYLAFSCLTGCATTRSEGCTTLNDPQAPAGWTVYSCPHAFPKLVGASTVDEHPATHTATVVEVQGLTDCEAKAVYVHDTYTEVLAHEYRHAMVCQ